ncbi:MAG TPA: hypothetical protein VEO53_16295, partial [Candidatus Binatia bacterium]|nr:hypothetical protein [Candidatus Binatia bacterium]
TPRLEAVDSCESLFVGVGGRHVLTSADGEHWLRQDLPRPGHLESVTCGNGRFVAVGWQGGDCSILSSPDGVTWTRQYPAFDGFAICHLSRPGG